MSAEGTRGRQPDLAGSLLLNPVALAALAVLVVNDHLLKRLANQSGRFEWLTGKLSDVAGMVFFPLLIVTACDLCLRVMAVDRPHRDRPLGVRPLWARRTVLGLAVLASGAVFSAIQLSTVAADWYEAVIGALRRLPASIAALVTGGSEPAAVEIRHVMDPTDLIGLIGLTLGYGVGANHLGLHRRAPSDARELRDTRAAV